MAVYFSQQIYSLVVYIIVICRNADTDDEDYDGVIICRYNVLTRGCSEIN